MMKLVTIRLHCDIGHSKIIKENELYLDDSFKFFFFFLISYVYVWDACINQNKSSFLISSLLLVSINRHVTVETHAVGHRPDS